MTTRELIEKLQELDPAGDAEVMRADDFYGLTELEYVEWAGKSTIRLS